MPKAIQRLRLLAATGSAIMLLSACGARQPTSAVEGAASPTATPAAALAVASAPKPVVASSKQATTVEVKLKTYGVTPSVATVKAGDVTFSVTNTATDLEHEMLVVRTDLAPDALPYDAATQQIPEEKIDSLGEVSELKPGTSGTVTLNLSPGKYLLFCNILSHFKHGMVAPLVVEP